VEAGKVEAGKVEALGRLLAIDTRSVELIDEPYKTKPPKKTFPRGSSSEQGTAPFFEGWERSLY
jgi:hypothetical protein